MNMKVQPIPGKNLAISFMMALVPCVCGWCGVCVCVCVWSGVGVVCGGVWSGCGSTCERIYIVVTFLWEETNSGCNKEVTC